MSELVKFADTLASRMTLRGEWNIRGFVDIARNIYALSSDAKVLEIH